MHVAMALLNGNLSEIPTIYFPCNRVCVWSSYCGIMPSFRVEKKPGFIEELVIMARF